MQNILAASLILFLSLASSADTALQILNLSKCSERVWPGYKMSGRKYLLSQETDHGWRAVDPDRDKIYELGAEDFKNVPQAKSYYSFFEHAGSHWVSIGPQILRDAVKPEEVLGLAVHEDFHRYRQSAGWFSAGGRATALPLDWRPRYYRAQIENYLRKAIEDPSSRQRLLQKARHWYELWRLNFPTEVSSTTDGFEGSAEFAEAAGISLGTLGCGISEHALRASIRERLLSVSSLIEVGGVPALDSEGYRIGSLSSFILRFELRNTDWLIYIEKAVTPLESLMNLIATSLPDVENPELVEKFKAQTEKYQKQIDDSLGSTLPLLRANNKVFVSVPHGWQEGALSYRGFYDLKDVSFSIGLFAQNFTMSGEAGTLNVMSGAARLYMPSPCPGGGWTFAVLESEISQGSKDRYTFSSDKISGVFFCSDDKGQRGAQLVLCDALEVNSLYEGNI